MNIFEGKVAVVTGSASGIGLGIATRCVQEGMKVVFADIADEKLFDAVNEIQTQSSEVLAIKCDVSKSDEVKNLAEKTIDKFGAVHLLVNNAGVATVGDFIHPLWMASDNDWKRIININLWGVINGIRSFVPTMLKQESEGYIVNTASIEGILSVSVNGIYAMTKHAVVSLTETLHYQLKELGSNIGVSVLCPGSVKSGIAESSRDYYELLNEPDLDGNEKEIVKQVIEEINSGLSPDDVADMVFNAISEKRLYVLTDSWPKEPIMGLYKNILGAIPPE